MRRTRRSFLASFGVGVSALSGCLTAEPSSDGTWPRRLVDNGHTGAVDTEGPTSSLYQFWEHARPGYRDASPVVGDDRVYHVTSREPGATDPGGTTLERFEAKTGESDWVVELFSTEASFLSYHTDSLVLEDDRAFVQTRAGLQTVGTDGEPEWTFPNVRDGELSHPATPPVVTDDVVVTGTHGTVTGDDPETVFGVDPDDRRQLWRTPLPELGAASQFTATGDLVYVSSHDSLVALERATGAERWRRSLPIRGAPTAIDGQLLVGLRPSTDEYRIAALDAETGDERWRVPTAFRWTSAGFSVADGHLYHVAGRRLVARSLKSGEEDWRFANGSAEARAVTIRTPAIAGDAVYVTGRIEEDDPASRLFVIDRKTGNELASQSLGWSASGKSVPAVTDGLVFVTSSGSIAAIGECRTEYADRCVEE